MRLITHVLFGLLVLKLLSLSSVLNIVLIIIGSVIPDLDYRFGLRHRTVTHSLLFIGFSLLINEFIGLGVALHVLLDLFTPMGVVLFYPKHDWFVLLGAPLRTGVHDSLISISALIGLVL